MFLDITLLYASIAGIIPLTATSLDEAFIILLVSNLSAVSLTVSLVRCLRTGVIKLLANPFLVNEVPVAFAPAMKGVAKPPEYHINPKEISASAIIGATADPASTRVDHFLPNKWATSVLRASSSASLIKYSLAPVC